MHISYQRFSKIYTKVHVIVYSHQKGCKLPNYIPSNTWCTLCYSNIHACSHNILYDNWQSRLKLMIFHATVLINKMVILTIYFCSVTLVYKQTYNKHYYNSSWERGSCKTKHFIYTLNRKTGRKIYTQTFRLQHCLIRIQDNYMHRRSGLWLQYK